MKRGVKARKVALMIVLGIALIFLFSFIVMALWNAILPKVTNVGALNFWQAMGLLVLSKILFSGFGRGRHGARWRHRMREKWQHMTPEEREKFKEEWKTRCRWKDPLSKDSPAPPEAETKSE